MGTWKAQHQAESSKVSNLISNKFKFQSPKLKNYKSQLKTVKPRFQLPFKKQLTPVEFNLIFLEPHNQTTLINSKVHNVTL